MGCMLIFFAAILDLPKGVCGLPILSYKFMDSILQYYGAFSPEVCYTSQCLKATVAEVDFSCLDIRCSSECNECWQSSLASRQSLCWGPPPSMADGGQVLLNHLSQSFTCNHLKTGNQKFVLVAKQSSKLEQPPMWCLRMLWRSGSASRTVFSWG